MVMALIATSIGSCSRVTCSRSMTTDVSRIPRERRVSDTPVRCLVDGGVEVVSPLVRVDAGGVTEHADDIVGGDEAVAAQRRELGDGLPIACDDERLALVDPAHDLAAVVAQLAL